MAFRHIPFPGAELADDPQSASAPLLRIHGRTRLGHHINGAPNGFGNGNSLGRGDGLDGPCLLFGELDLGPYHDPSTDCRFDGMHYPSLSNLRTDRHCRNGVIGGMENGLTSGRSLSPLPSEAEAVRARGKRWSEKRVDILWSKLWALALRPHQTPVKAEVLDFGEDNPGYVRMGRVDKDVMLLLYHRRRHAKQQAVTGPGPGSP